MATKTGSKTHSAGNIKRGRAWKLERASVSRKAAKRPKSNKYSKSGDSYMKPGSGERTRAWVGGYTRADGKKVKGHYREIGQRRTANSRNGSRTANAVESP